MHWNLGNVGPLHERVRAEKELEREERMPIRREDQVSELVHKGRRVVAAIEAELAREKEVLKAIDMYFDHELDALKMNLLPIRNSLNWPETESLRRQKACVAVLEDELHRLRLRVAHALSSLELELPEEAPLPEHVPSIDDSGRRWGQVRSWFGIG